jgi:hypothetical protein
MKLTLKFDNTKFSKREVYRKFFTLISILNPDKDKRLQDCEIDMIAEFMMLPPKYDYYRFASPSKKRVIKTAKEELDWNLSATNIRNKLYSLIKKDILVRDEDQVIYFKPYIRTMLEEIRKGNGVNITTIFNLNDEKPNII